MPGSDRAPCARKAPRLEAARWLQHAIKHQYGHDSILNAVDRQTPNGPVRRYLITIDRGGGRNACRSIRVPNAVRP